MDAALRGLVHDADRLAGDSAPSGVVRVDYATVGDVHGLWSATFSGEDRATGAADRDGQAAQLGPRGRGPLRAGVWVDADRDDVVVLEGADAGVSFRRARRRRPTTTYTVVSNSSDGGLAGRSLLRERLSARGRAVS